MTLAHDNSANHNSMYNTYTNNLLTQYPNLITQWSQGNIINVLKTNDYKMYYGKAFLTYQIMYHKQPKFTNKSDKATNIINITVPNIHNV